MNVQLESAEALRKIALSDANSDRAIFFSVNPSDHEMKNRVAY